MIKKLHYLLVALICMAVSVSSFAKPLLKEKTKTVKKSVKKEEPYVKFKQKYTGTVEAYNLNLRIKPSTLYTVVGRVKDGEKLEVVGNKGIWLQVKAPDSVEVWVSKRFIKDNKITTKVNLRGGPSINHQIYAIAPRGMPVAIVNDKRTDWVQIKPPPNTFVWVSKQYVSFSPTAKRDMANEIAGIKGLVNQKIIPLDYVSVPAEKITQTGIVVILTANNFGLKYALCDAKDRSKKLAYLKITEASVKKFFGKLTTIQGDRRWVRGWTCPIIEVKSLKLKKK